MSDVITRPGTDRLRMLMTNLVIVGAATGFVLSYLRPDLLFLKTVITGGDTPSHYHPALHLRDVLLPMGRTVGWDMGNYAGYPVLQFYFVVPFLLIALLGSVIPIEIAFKVVTVSGLLTFPVATFYCFRALRYPFPIPAIATACILPFLFQEGNSMWGGNIPSTLAGEFCHSIGLSFALFFLGSVATGLRTGRHWIGSALLMTACSLSHTYAFLFAGLASVLLVHTAPSLRDGVKHLAKVYAFAFCFMAFWTIPLLEKIDLTTAWVFSWDIHSWTEVIPRLLLPVLVLAVVDAVVTLGGLRPRGASRSGFLVLTIVGSGFMYLSAPTLGLLDIRFVPTIQLLLCFMSADLLALFIHRVKPKTILALLILGGSMMWTNMNVGYLPHWIEWNYEGFQRKTAWPIFRDLTGFLKGTFADPRVAYEFSPRTNMFGTVRAFESIPYFSGRQTLEGTLIHSAINGPFIYYMQSELSETGTNPIPGYSYSRFDLERGIQHLQMFNVREMIAVSDKVTEALGASEEYEEVFRRDEYVIFRLRSAPEAYVSVPRYWPVLYETDDWRQSFHRWFTHMELLDIPLVATELVPADARTRFDLRAKTLEELPRRTVQGQGDCVIDETILDAEVRFTTSCPGKPHIIAVSYFPNWRVEGASRIFPVSPAFMLVFPEEREVRLWYGRTPGDIVGWMLTGGAMLLAAILAMRGGVRSWAGTEGTRGGLGRRVDSLLDGIERRKWTAVAILALPIVAVTAYSAYHRVESGASQRIYAQAWEDFQAHRYEVAIRQFGRVISYGTDPHLVAASYLYAGYSEMQLGRPEEAVRLFETLSYEFPESVFRPEALYHLGGAYFQVGRREDTTRVFREIIRRYPDERWAGFAADRLREAEPTPPAPPAETDPAAPSDTSG